MKKIKSISLGYKRIMLIDMENNLYGCGRNYYGELGLDETSDNIKLTRIPLPKGKKPILVACSFNHSIILTEDNKIYSFGLNQKRQLGFKNKNEDDYESQYITKATLMPLPKYIKPIDITLGNDFSFILSEDGNLYSFGDNSFGQLGIGNKKMQKKPQLVIFPDGVKANTITSNGNHSLVIGTDGNLYGFGQNKHGQLGLGDKRNRATPTKIDLPNEVKPIKISVGFFHSLVVGSDGNLYFSGENSDRVLEKKEDIKTKFTLFKLPNEAKPKLIAADAVSSMVFADNNVLYTWGANDYGHFETSEELRRYKEPRSIPLPQNIKPISLLSGSFFSMIIDENDTIYAWGDNESGQLIEKEREILIPKKINLI